MLPNSNTHLFTSRLGLETQRTTNPKCVREERKSNHARSGGVWDHVERNWSVYGQIKTTSRNRMSHAVGDKLVYVHEALHMKLKLQHASYTQHAEKWDSDSDSDESDDEDDLKV